MAISEHTRALSESREGAITRRSILARAPAAAAAIALPAGGAMLALPADAGMVDDSALIDAIRANPEPLRRFMNLDAGLPQLEAGYERWRAIMADMRRVDDEHSATWRRAEAEVEHLFPPQPERAPAIAEWVGEGGAYTHGLWNVPEKLRSSAQAYHDAVIEWRHAKNDLVVMPRHVDALRAESERLDREAEVVRKEVLAIPTRSPRGLLLKLAIAVEADSVDGMAERFADPAHFGTFDPWVVEDFLPALAVDLRAMVGAAA